jgi:hypothetical protein
LVDDIERQAALKRKLNDLPVKDPDAILAQEPRAEEGTYWIRALACRSRRSLRGLMTLPETTALQAEGDPMGFSSAPALSPAERERRAEITQIALEAGALPPA